MLNGFPLVDVIIVNALLRTTFVVLCPVAASLSRLAASATRKRLPAQALHALARHVRDLCQP